MKETTLKFIKFGLIGVIATLIDYVVIIICKEKIGMTVLWSSFMGFCISLIFNYILNMKYVFKKKEGMKDEHVILVFLITSVIGLGINQLIIYVFSYLKDVHYLISKLIATGVVMIWNFVSKKLLIEKK